MSLIMGIKNIGRNKRRSFINILTIGFAIFAIVIFGSIAEGEWIDVVENYAKMGFGQVRINRKGYSERDVNNLKFLIERAEDIIPSIEKVGGVKFVLPHLKTGGLLIFQGKQKPVMVKGIDFQWEKESGILKNIKGEIPGENAYSAVIGRSLAERLKANIGDIIFLYGRTGSGTINLIDLEISGIYTAPLKAYEEGTIYLPLKTVEEFLGVDGISEISVILRPDKNPDDVAKEINSLLMDDLEAYSIFQYMPVLDELRTLQSGFMDIFYLIILSIAIFGIVNIMLISVWERKKEIGTLRAIGYSKMGVSSIFISESVSIGLIGGLLGISLGGVVSALMQHYGIPLPQTVMEDFDFPLSSRLYGILSTSILIKGLVISILATLLGSIIPAIRASGLKIVDVLREY